MMQLATVALGGAVGSVLRFGLQSALNNRFPVGTMLVNLLGCFAVGALAALVGKGLDARLQLLLVTGFCGGFTTFSAFSLESIQLFQSGRWPAFAAYVALSVVGGLLATALGFKIVSS